MQKDSKFFDDLARMASGAAGEFMEMKREMDHMIGLKLEKFMEKMQLPSKEEVETLHGMLAKLRTEQEESKKRLETLEKQIEKLLKNNN